MPAGGPGPSSGTRCCPPNSPSASSNASEPRSLKPAGDTRQSVSLHVSRRAVRCGPGTELYLIVAGARRGASAREALHHASSVWPAGSRSRDARAIDSQAEATHGAMEPGVAQVERGSSFAAAFQPSFRRGRYLARLLLSSSVLVCRGIWSLIRRAEPCAALTHAPHNRVSGGLQGIQPAYVVENYVFCECVKRPIPAASMTAKRHLRRPAQVSQGDQITGFSVGRYTAPRISSVTSP